MKSQPTTNILHENIAICLRFTIDFILFVIFCSSVQTSDFLTLPLATSWFSLVIAGIYLLARGSSPAHLSVSIGMFATQLTLGSVTTVVLTSRAQGGRLCSDLNSLSNPCGVGRATVGLSWLATAIALAAILLLPCAGLWPRLRLGLCTRRKSKKGADSNEHAIELSSLPAYRQPSNDQWKGGWTDIPV